MLPLPTELRRVTRVFLDAESEELGVYAPSVFRPARGSSGNVDLRARGGKDGCACSPRVEPSGCNRATIPLKTYESVAGATSALTRSPQPTSADPVEQWRIFSPRSCRAVRPPVEALSRTIRDESQGAPSALLRGRHDPSSLTHAPQRAQVHDRRHPAGRSAGA